MHIGALLQLLRGSILNDRTDRVDGTSDYLWEDETLITFINEAQRRFAVRGLVLRDSTTHDVACVHLVAGQRDYILHKSVIAVISANRHGFDQDLQRVGHSLLGFYRAPSDTWADAGYFNGLPAGPTLGFSTDEELAYGDGNTLSRVSLRVFPTPSATEDGKCIRLRVVRKPLTLFTIDDL